MKRLGIVMLVVLMLLSMTACTSSEDTPLVMDDPISFPEKSGTSDELQVWLDSVAVLPVGTMGVSMQAISLAVECLDWSQATAMTESEIRTVTQDYYDTVIDPDIFIEQMTYVTAYFDLLADPAQREITLGNAGIDAATVTWTEKAFTTSAVFTTMLAEGFVGSDDTTEPTAAPVEGTVDESVADSAENTELTLVLDSIADVPVAVAGNFLRVLRCSIHLLDACEATVLSDEELRAFVEEYDATCDDSAHFRDVLADALAECENLHNEDTRADIMSSVGEVPEDHPWTETAFENVGVIGALVADWTAA